MCDKERERERESDSDKTREERTTDLVCVCARGREGGEVLDRKKCISERGIHANDS